MWRGDDIIVRGNHCHHNGATGIQIESGGEDDISERIVVENNLCEYNSQIYQSETGIWIDDSDDILVAYVTNSAAGTLSVIDTQRLEKISDLKTGDNPVAVGFSALGQAAYVAHEADGSVTVIERESPSVAKRIAGEPGVVAFRFAPGGRWGFAVNVKTNQVTVIDASTNRVAHVLDVDESPDRVTFTDTFAYVHHLGSPFVHLIQLVLGIVHLLGGDEPPFQDLFLFGQMIGQEASAVLEAL